MTSLPPSRPRQLGPWRLERVVGQGGMGTVFAGVHQQSGQRRAIKTLKTARGDPYWVEDVARFRREVALVTRLTHPNVVRVEQAELDHDPPYLVMHLLEGGSLNDRVRAGPLSVERALEIALALASALAHAHALGVLHRDLKPANILFGGDERPFLVDFGLARGTGSSVERLTQTGELLGTPRWMAPEQTVDARLVDARTDVYGLGALVYFMLTGSPPFDALNLLGVVAAVRHDPPPALEAARPGVPKGLARVVQRAMAKDPEERYPCVADMALDLQATRDATATSTAPSAGGRPVQAGLGILALVGLFLLGLGLPRALNSDTAGAGPGPPSADEPAPPNLAASDAEAAPAPVTVSQGQLPWPLSSGDVVTLQLSESLARPGESDLLLANWTLTFELRVGDVVDRRAQVTATILRLRAWVQPEGHARRYDSLRPKRARSPFVEIYDGLIGAEVQATLDLAHGDAAAVHGGAHLSQRVTAALPPEVVPTDWAAEAIAYALRDDRWEELFDSVARGRHVEAPSVGGVSRLPSGLLDVALLSEERDLGQGPRLTMRRLETVEQVVVPPASESYLGKVVGMHRLATVILINDLVGIDDVRAGESLLQPRPFAWPAPKRLLETRHPAALRASPWGPVLGLLPPKILLGGFDAKLGWRRVCFGGAEAWCWADDLVTSSHEAVEVVDHQAFAYPGVDRTPRTARGVLPVGCVVPVLERAGLARGHKTVRLCVPYAAGQGWILEKDTKPLNR